MDGLRLDLRYALRSLRRNLGTTGAAILCLALGIGATTTVWTGTRALVLMPVPARESHRVVHVSELPPNAQTDASGVSLATFLDWERDIATFGAVAIYDWWNVNLTGVREAERVIGYRVSPDFFSILDAKPLLGRLLQREDARRGADVVVLSHGLWRRALGGDTDVIGRSVNLDGRPFTVVGVMREEFLFPEAAELWAPFAFTPAEAQDRKGAWLEAFARLAPGASVGQARQEVLAMQARIASAYPETRADWSARVVPIQEWFGRHPRPFGLLLLASVLFVLLIACANVANLLLARGTARDREVAVRVTLGAARSRIIRQFLVESVVLALAAGAAGVVVALWGVLVFRNLIPPELRQFNLGFTQIRVDATVLLFTTAVSVLTGILFGIVPSLHAARGDLQVRLRELGRGTTGGRARKRLRSILVAGEIALALVLLVGTGLMLRNLIGLIRVDPGFQTANILAIDIALDAERYDTPQKYSSFHARLAERLREIPGVMDVAYTSIVPMSWLEHKMRGASEAQTGVREADLPSFRARSVSEGFFSALRIPVVQGRDFTEHDDLNAPLAVVVSQLFAARLWPDEDAIGKRIRLIGDTLWREVVGVVSDVHHNPNLGPSVQATLYLPLRQRPRSEVTALLRTTGIVDAIALVTRRLIAELDPRVAPGSVRTLERIRSNALSPQRATASLLGGFSVIAMVLALVGVFGVVSYSVRQRADEIGVRMALGARPADVVRLILKEGLVMVGAGIAFGTIGGVLLAQSLRTLLVGVSVTDPATFASGTTLLAVIGLLACLIPALRATRYDPARLLRYD